jgi:hypothetical protein
MAPWIHRPISDKEFFVVIIEQSSRFKIGRILHIHPTKTGTWDNGRKIYEELWLSIFGQAQIIHIEPAGTWKN